jgi:phosphoribosylanthranilate isomerase
MIGATLIPRIKICGLTTVTDALACCAAGADWIGLNFHPPSPRCVELAVAAAIVRALPPEVQTVGLFVNRPAREVADRADALGLKIVQLHGDEPPEDVVALGHLTVVRAFRLNDAPAIAKMSAYLQEAEALGRAPDAVLVDAYTTTVLGGSGQTLPDPVLDLLPPLPRLILAGGLTPENVAARVARVNPWMVDVASGVESSPGRKDRARVEAFIRAARNASLGTPIS